jgi:hypothetical protein
MSAQHGNAVTWNIVIAEIARPTFTQSYFDFTQADNGNTATQPIDFQLVDNGNTSQRSNVCSLEFFSPEEKPPSP